MPALVVEVTDSVLDPVTPKWALTALCLAIRLNRNGFGESL